MLGGLPGQRVQCFQICLDSVRAAGADGGQAARSLPCCPGAAAEMNAIRRCPACTSAARAARAPSLVVGHHLVAGDAVDPAIEQHQREPFGLGLHQMLALVAVRGRDDDPVDAFVEQQFEAELLGLQVLVGVDDHHLVAVPARGVADAASGLREERVAHVGDDNADGGRGAGADVPGDHVRSVAQLHGGGGDPGAHRWTDRAVAAQYPRCGRPADPGNGGHIGQRRGAVLFRCCQREIFFLLGLTRPYLELHTLGSD